MKKYLFLLGFILCFLPIGLDAQEQEMTYRYYRDGWDYFGEVNSNNKLNGKGRQKYDTRAFDQIIEGTYENGELSIEHPISYIWGDVDSDRSYTFNIVPNEDGFDYYFKYKDLEVRALPDSGFFVVPSGLMGKYNGSLFIAQPVQFNEQGHKYMSFSGCCYDAGRRAMTRSFLTQRIKLPDEGADVTTLCAVMDSCDEIMRILQHSVSQEWLSFYEKNLKGKTFVYQDHLNAEKSLFSTYVVRFYETQEAFFVRECSIDPEYFQDKTRRDAIEKQRIGDAFSSPESFYEVSFENGIISFKKTGKVVYDLTPEEERQQRAMAGLTQNRRPTKPDESRKRYVIPYEENTCGIYSGKNYKIDEKGNLIDIDLGITLIATDTELKEEMLNKAIENSQTKKSLDAVLTLFAPLKGEPMFPNFEMDVIQEAPEDEERVDKVISFLQELTE